MRFDQPFCSFGKFWWSKIMPETIKDWLQKDRVHANCKAMPPSMFYETKMSILREKKKDLLKITNKERKTLI